MCGLAGTLNKPVNAGDILNTMLHRGPDDRASVTVNNVQLLHVRLAIIDAIGGAQPMQREQFVIAYNGEIYNHLALRAEFDLACNTHSDTETILALFEKMGTDCFAQLDGMFAIALYDTLQQKLYLARDRAGEKPLYIKHKSNQFCFASELNTLHALDALEVDDVAINTYLSTGIFYQKQTAYRDVFECPPGCFVSIDTQSGEYALSRWFGYAAKAVTQTQASVSESDWIQSIDTALHESIKDRLLASDVEVGAFLSGGIDSGLVTAIASEYTNRLKTFTVSFDGQFDESTLAAQVAKKYNTQHNVLKVDYQDLDKNIENILLNYGEPICDDSIIPTWYVSKAAREHVSVVLTGDGADELFGGYRRYVPYAKFNLFNTSKATGHVVNPLLGLMPKPQNKMSYYNYLYRFLTLLGKSGVDRYCASTTNIIGTALKNKQHDVEMVQAYENLATGSASSLEKLMRMDFHTLLAGVLLPKMDIGSMAHSLETRSPFLSARLLDIAPAMPAHLKINGKTTKYALRELAGKYLPEQLQHAPKRGFETPLSQWLGGKLQDPVHSSLSNSNAYVRQFYEPGYIDNLLQSVKKTQSTQTTRTLWMLYCVEIWASKFVR